MRWAVTSDDARRGLGRLGHVSFGRLFLTLLAPLLLSAPSRAQEAIDLDTIRAAVEFYTSSINSIEGSFRYSIEEESEPGPGRIDQFEFPAQLPGPLVTEFVLTNTGHETVEITNVASSCMCATVDVPHSQLLPRSDMALRVVMARPVIGTETATVVIETNSTTTPSLELRLTASARNNSPRIAAIMPRRVVIDRSDSTASVQVTTLERADCA